MSGLSFVVPVRDGARHLDACLEGIYAQSRSGAVEVLAIDDASRDGSRSILERWQRTHGLILLEGGGRGVATALNLGIAAARHPVICQVDQDVELSPGWSAVLVAALGDPGVAAAQGWYATAREDPLLARVTGLDVEQRWLAIGERDSGHVASGHTAYRRAAVIAVGGFNEELGYGADVDLSYRLCAAGHRLRICPQARSRHHWRGGMSAWLAQQYGYGYGRLDVLARHPRRIGGDDVARTAMMLHAPLTLGALVLLPLWPAAGALLLAVLGVERLRAGLSAGLRFRDPAALLFPLAHLARDLAWAAAIAVWLGRRLRGVASSPAHSMLRARG